MEWVLSDLSDVDEIATDRIDLSDAARLYREGVFVNCGELDATRGRPASSACAAADNNNSSLTYTPNLK